MKNFQILILIFLFTSCSKNQNKELKQDNFPKLTNVKTVQSKFKNDTSVSRSSSNILYIGNLKDSIKLDFSLVEFPFAPPPPPFNDNGKLDTVESKKIITKFNQKFKSNPVYPYYLSWEKSQKFNAWDSSKVSIQVDTNTITKQLVVNKNFQKEYYTAYPVLLKNEEQDTIRIGYDRFIPIILEAKDSTNQWKPIEKMFSFMCGNGLNSLILPPKDIIVSSKVIYKGDYKTDLRIKMGNNYSNKFKGSINYSQFENSRY